MVEKPKIKKKSIKKKHPDPINMVTGNIYNTVLTGSYTPTADRLAIAKSLTVLRGIEVRKTEELEIQLMLAYKNCREKLVKMLIETVLNHDLRLVDAQLIYETLATEVSLLSVWEYEHLDQSDEFFAKIVPSKSLLNEEGKKVNELFEMLGKRKDEGGDDNGNN